jgi:hypothetical protein
LTLWHQGQVGVLYTLILSAMHILLTASFCGAGFAFSLFTVGKMKVARNGYRVASALK